jgi:nucleoid-associated protein YgaU
MAKETSGASGASLGPILGAAAVGGVLVAAAVAFVTLRGPDDPAPEPGQVTEGATQAPDAAEAPEPATADAPAPEADTTAPRFDVVRVDASGSAVIAGRAGAGASVTLKLDGDPVETVEADGGGGFVAMLALSPSAVPRILSLEAALPGGDPVPGAATVMIAPFAGTALAEATPPDPPPAQSADRPGIGEATSTSPAAPAAGDAAAVIADAPAPSAAAPGSPPEADIASADLPEAPTAPVDAPETPLPDAPSVGVATPDGSTPPEAPAAAPRAPAVLMADADGVRVLQAPGAAPIAQTEIRLDAITYDITGDVTLAGRGPAEASVRVTLNNQPINMGEIGPGGQWSLGLPDVDPGTYTLRLEQLAADGTVTRTVTTPFLREDPARIRANPMLVDPGASVITVQRGFTLWGIAEANFGDGILYVQIFEENRGEIRDPDLIFPGQIFALPDLPRTGGGD